VALDVAGDSLGGGAGQHFLADEARHFGEDEVVRRAGRAVGAMADVMARQSTAAILD
jgi:hypothetical protein